MNAFLKNNGATQDLTMDKIFDHPNMQIFPSAVYLQLDFFVIVEPYHNF